jgi:hypothetical protein
MFLIISFRKSFKYVTFFFLELFGHEHKFGTWFVNLIFFFPNVIYYNPLALNSLQEIPTFLIGNFSQKKPPCVFFVLMSNLTKSAILDKSIWTQPFWLSFFGWSFWLGFFSLNHHDNNIIWATTRNIYYLNYFILTLIWKYELIN